MSALKSKSMSDKDWQALQRQVTIRLITGTT
jgi:hypothetical protein